MTTNLGNEKTVDYLLSGGTGFAKNINHKTSTTQMPAKEMVEKNTLDAVRKHFRPEFINRLDKIIVFNHLDRSNLEKIAELEMSIIMDKLSKKGYFRGLRFAPWHQNYKFHHCRCNYNDKVTIICKVGKFLTSNYS